ncbi:cobaltochelatase subunit CobN [Methanolobus vulcani]
MELVANTTSDINGDYSFNDVPNGDYQLVAIMYTPAMGGKWLMDEADVTIEDGQDIANANLTLGFAEAGAQEPILSLMDRAAISGTTLSTPGGVGPLVGISDVNVVLKTESELVANTTSDINGVYSFSDVPNGDYQLVAIMYTPAMGGKWLMDEADVTIEDGQDIANANLTLGFAEAGAQEPILSLMDRAAISGTTLSTPGGVGPLVGISDVNVVLKTESELVANTTSDINGDYSFSDVPNGDYQLVAIMYTPAMGGKWLMDEADVTIEDGQDIANANLTLGFAEAGAQEPILSLMDRAAISGKTLSTPGGVGPLVGISDVTVTLLKRVSEISDQSTSHPVAKFSANTTSGDAPLAVQFTDESENATSWFWDFGDGTNSTTQNPFHVYDSVGSYTVTLTITTPDDAGTEIKKDFITTKLPETYKDKNILFLAIGAQETCRLKDATTEMGMQNIDVYGSYRMNVVDNLYSPFDDSIDMGMYDIIFISRKGGMSFLGENLKPQILEMMENTKSDVQVVDWNYGVGTVNHTAHPYIADYWDEEYDGNVIRLITYLSVVDLSRPFSEYDGTIQIEEPSMMPEVGIYHPDANTVFDDLESYLEWYEGDTGTHHVYNPDNYTIGITFFTAYDEGVCDSVTESVIRELESRGINTIPAYRPDVLYSDKAYDFFTVDNEWKTDAFIDLGKGVWIMSSAVRNTEYLQEANVPVINGIIYQGTIEEWGNSSTGQDCWFQYQIPIMEIGGEIESIVVGGQEYDENLGARVLKPIDYQVDWLVDRTVSWIDLRHIEEENKKVAVIYYAHGKQSALVASNLDVAPSIPNLLNAMNQSVYDLGGTQLNESEFLETVLEQGRNIGVWAPGELEYMVENYDVELLPVETYLEWFNSEIEPEARQSVLDTWGEAPGPEMVYENESGKYFVFPKIEVGNVLVLPQPTRGFSQDDTLLYHDQTMPPSHHYIAFYLWLNNGFDADSIVHFGRHGTQEWLQGKGTSLSVKTCWPAILIQDTPVVYLYDVGGIGEGITAKRRGNAVMVDHATPAIVSAGLYGNLTLLHDKMHYYETEEDPVMAEIYKRSIIETYDELNFEQEFNVSADDLEDMDKTEFDSFVLTGPVHDYLHELASEYIPYGLHILGEQMDDKEVIAMVKSMLGQDFEEHVEAICDDPDEVDVAHSPNILDYLLEDVLLNEISPTDAITSRFDTSGYVTNVVASTTCDEYGAYEFSNVKDGDYTVYAAKYIDAMNFWMVNKESLHIENDQDVFDKDICIVSDHEELDHVLSLLNDARLIGDASISGKTFANSPMGLKYLSGSYVALKHGTEVLEVTVSDSEGAYQFTELADGEYTVVAIYYSDDMNFWMIGETTVSISSGQDIADQNIELKTDSLDEVDAILSELPIASISGKTFANGYNGLTNRSGSIVVLKQGTEVLNVTESDFEGTYRFTGLTDGEYTVIAINYISEMQFWMIGETTVTIQSAESVEGLDLELQVDNNNDADVVLSLIGSASVSGKVYSSGQMGYMDQPGSIVIIVQTQADITKEQDQVVDDLDLAILYAENIKACKDEEIQSMLNALDGQYITPALGDDPVRSPDVLPTGKNFFAFNPSLVPTEEAWDAGMTLVDAFLDEWVSQNGEYPGKVGFVLWSGESMRHKGVMESEILYMMGVRPVWDSSGNVIDVEIIPEDELKRPRIDAVVTMTGIYRDNWKWQVELMDRGARLAAIEDSSLYANYVSENSDLIYEALMATGNYSEEDARQLSMCRVFGPDEGSWGAGGFREAVSASGTWEDESELANLYIDSMSYAYGDEIWGNCDGNVFRSVLSNTDAVMFSRSGNDNRGSGSVVFDHVYEFFGGFGMAVRNISGYTPEMYIANLKNPNEACVETLSEFLTRDLRSRYFNPKWIEGMMGHDYTGASEIDSVLEDFFGLGVTLPGEISDDMWDEFYDVYVLDKYNLGLDEWFQGANPWAKQSMNARMLEAIRKTDGEGNPYWDASDEQLRTLVEEYVESVVENGVTCCHHTCGNAQLADFIDGQMQAAGVTPEMQAAYNKLMYEATLRDEFTTQQQTDTSSLQTHDDSLNSIQRAMAAGSSNQTMMADSAGAGTDYDTLVDDSAKSTPDNYIEGYEMTKESVIPVQSSSFSFSSSDIIASIFVMGVVGVIYLGFWRRKKI